MDLEVLVVDHLVGMEMDIQEDIHPMMHSSKLQEDMEEAIKCTSYLVTF
jgi:hypothetical protein